LELETRFSHTYDFQPVFLRRPSLYQRKILLVANMRVSYGIIDIDFYNFGKIGFIVGSDCVNRQSPS